MRTVLLAASLMALAGFTTRAADQKAGQAIYDKHCKGCHGPNGAAPPNVTKLESGHMPDLRSFKTQSLSDAELGKIVTNGKGKMRGDTTVSGKEVDDLVAFIRTLKG
jgi:mono/diheme cytochrome c family protein